MILEQWLHGPGPGKEKIVGGKGGERMAKCELNPNVF